jgi:crotonobetainyl-CoA:carnitine CoA-transferase CaiB-like acyl-CoA transferase
MQLHAEIAEAFQIDGVGDASIRFSTVGEGDLPSWFCVTDLATASIGAAGAMLGRLASKDSDNRSAVVVDRRLASLWFSRSLLPLGWELPPVWDSIAGVYKTKDGWIRLHTNAPHHREAALAVLGQEGERSAVAVAVARWEAEDLETAIVDAGGCAAMLRSLDAWAHHPQGSAVAGEPLIIWDVRKGSLAHRTQPVPGAPLLGVRVLDLTRVLAGPIATRFLAGFGADVLRIDPLDWDEPAAIPETTLGKRRVGLNLHERADRRTFEQLLSTADVLVHGYRPGALDGLGFDCAARSVINPNLVDVSLNAYGWSGPWSDRRGFDSLVQMSSGIADFGMRRSSADQPVPLPVQALDHATGYLMAAAVLQGLAKRREGKVLSARLSLARTAHLLATARNDSLEQDPISRREDDFDQGQEETAWGPARRLRFPLTVDGFAPDWRFPAGHLRSHQATWLERS